MNDVTVFSNEEFGRIRTLQIDGEFFFAGKDVAQALGYRNCKDALYKHVDPEDKQLFQRSQNATFDVPTRGITIINESGLYSLILSSKLPNAKRFKRWVTGEVLPELRRSGRYSVDQSSALRPLTPDDYLRAAAILATCKYERLPYALDLMEQAGIRISHIPDRSKERDVSTANLINRACSEHGITLRAIERASGVYAAQLARIRRGESFPDPARAAIIRDAIERLLDEKNE